MVKKMRAALKKIVCDPHDMLGDPRSGTARVGNAKVVVRPLTF